jgi:hypothetical protein
VGLGHGEGAFRFKSSPGGRVRGPVHPDREHPFFFQKFPDNIVPSGPKDNAKFPYPPLSKNVHHEIELVAALGKGGSNVSAKQAMDRRSSTRRRSARSIRRAASATRRRGASGFPSTAKSARTATSIS